MSAARGGAAAARQAHNLKAPARSDRVRIRPRYRCRRAVPHSARRPAGETPALGTAIAINELLSLLSLSWTPMQECAAGPMILPGQRATGQTRRFSRNAGIYRSGQVMLCPWQQSSTSVRADSSRSGTSFATHPAEGIRCGPAVSPCAGRRGPAAPGVVRSAGTNTSSSSRGTCWAGLPRLPIA